MKEKAISQEIKRRYDAIASKSDGKDKSCCEGFSCGQGLNESGLGCANLAGIVQLFPGEVLLDLGSGPGLETIALARRIEPAIAFGLDQSPAMVKKAEENAKRAGVSNVRFLTGSMEEIPLEDESVDVVVSNCAVNLASKKESVVEGVARVLRPGGRLVIADVVWLQTPPAEVRKDPEAWAMCFGGALEVRDYEQLLKRAGFEAIDIKILSPFNAGSVSIKPSSALITARKPKKPDEAAEIRQAKPEDLAVVLRILEAADLPTDGVADWIDNFIVAQTHTGIAGIAGMERYGVYALLRSVVVLPRWRGCGLGRRLVDTLMSKLPEIKRVYLLTTTANDFFSRLGFKEISWGELPEELRASKELQGACPRSATAMRLSLP
ncbi:arsenic resistance N-acetyltransferase ArsN2 [Acetomicrobium sp. S15 = DSM 107314]|uniref:arsenic resistance N-acetyltransferase ArsN2 n=1 Tax=Acetomicrobium sp. S15 = DSM 107314 TaxID=2529858 RepID=UPI0018E0D751|nr:arsenic resistance N-acetyltransferase ArsN2 [Acetomicrobium sp. S15 = DSM 107314]